MKQLKQRLDAEVALRNCAQELSLEKPDPLMIAREYGDECNALTCAVFAYGNVRAIVGFLKSLESNLIDLDEASIRLAVVGKYYRFQSNEDIVQWFVTLGELKRRGGAQKAFQIGYEAGGILAGLSALIETLYALNPYRSQGYAFLIGKSIGKNGNASAMKRWMMYLRWMVRSDALDMGLWSVMPPSELIMPMDTHTFKVSTKLGLLHRKQCDLRAAQELTDALKKFDPNDPIKYDFALYRLGQEGIV